MTMFYVTKKGSYSIRALLQLAANIKDKGRTHIGEIADQTHIPEPFLRKIFANMAKNGIVRSKRGLSGGVDLLHEIDDITVYDVMIAVEGELAIYKCLKHPEICSKSGNCQTQNMWKAIQDNLVDSLKKIKIKHLYDGDDILGCIHPELGVRDGVKL
jgi:Rrf2 family transcriptional regulator, nitric oxide-sensitive transcriptional repressor